MFRFILEKPETLAALGGSIDKKNKINALKYFAVEILIIFPLNILKIFSIPAFAAAIAADGLHGAHGGRGARRGRVGRRGGRSGFRRGGRQDDALTAGNISNITMF